MAIIASFDNLPNIGDVVKKIEIKILSPGEKYDGTFYQDVDYIIYVGDKKIWRNGEDLVIKSKKDKYPEGVYTKEEFIKLTSKK